MAFLVLEWDDADVEYLEGGASGDYGRASGPGGQSADVPADADSATLEQLALASDIAQKWLEGKAPRRVIVVPGKLVNLVP